MTNSATFRKELYQVLGSLFYAVASVDGSVNPAEISKLEDNVKQRWLNPADTPDEYGSAPAYQIISVFDWMAAEKMSFDKAYRVFTTFFNNYRPFINDNLKQRILMTTFDIVLAFDGENKYEHDFIEKLTGLMYQGEKVECTV